MLLLIFKNNSLILFFRSLKDNDETAASDFISGLLPIVSLIELVDTGLIRKIILIQN